jgi:hypothetical protein
MSDPPDKVTPRRTRGETVPETLRVKFIRRRATRAGLQMFKTLWVDADGTCVVAMTQDKKLAEMWKHYRSYVRDSQTDTHEYEVVFDHKSVENALWVLAHRRA